MKLDEKDVIIELRGNSRCLIEGMDLLEGYEENAISVKVKGTVVRIRGKGLTMFMLSEDRLGVRGEIDVLEFGGVDDT
ncbi:MAG: YabP/YqfC family sporulation protein [Clostridia bacterium]|nr:YabP/YqfC family sporulation protein [Clostridia bacterium]